MIAIYFCVKLVTHSAHIRHFYGNHMASKWAHIWPTLAHIQELYIIQTAHIWHTYETLMELIWPQSETHMAPIQHTYSNHISSKRHTYGPYTYGPHTATT